MLNEITYPEPTNETARQVDAIVRQLLSDTALFVALQERLAKFIVFDQWTPQKHSDGHERLEPGKNESRVFVYETEDKGWYYRVGFGVIGIAGFSNSDPFPNAGEAMAAVDEILRSQDDIVAA